MLYPSTLPWYHSTACCPRHFPRRAWGHLPGFPSSMSLRDPSPARRDASRSLWRSFPHSAGRPSLSRPLDMLKSVMRKHNTGILLYVLAKPVHIVWNTSSYPAKINTPIRLNHAQTLSLMPRRARARAAEERRLIPVCAHAYDPRRDPVSMG